MADVAHGPTLATTAPTGTERLAEGARAGEYVVERFVGAGAMGEVYAGRHPVIGKRVAIKVLRRELATSDEAARRFIREAQAANQIDHENVIDVFAFGRLDDGRLYLVMDLVEGKSLRALLADGALPVAEALDLLAAIAAALDAAHARGVVHRDLKPDNIMHTTSGRVLVLDFGIAKLVSQAQGEVGPGTLTGQGTWMGTPGYMAPEQWSADGARVASDRYALGVIAFELIAGKLPFSASSIPGMMEQHFRAEVPALSARGIAGIPAAVDEVLARAMAKDPDARFPTATAMVEALRAAVGASGGSRSAPRSRMIVPAIAGAAVLGVAVIALATIKRGSHDATPAARAPVAPGSITVEISSSPSDAEVTRDGRILGATPLAIAVEPGTRVEVVVSKPGYLARTHAFPATAGAREQVALVPVSAFRGVWQLPDGELRAFDRIDEQVAVDRVESVSGPHRFMKRFDFVPAATGVAFAARDEIVDEHAPDDQTCHVPVGVEYRYDPQTDALEVHRDRVTIDFVGGHCVVHDRTVETLALRRVDEPSPHVTEHAAPVGVPPKMPTMERKQVIPLDPKGEVQQKLNAAAQQQQALSDTQDNAPGNTVFPDGDSQQARNALPKTPVQLQKK